jgi:predicted molibdopterin-dependent oxidoreductase YjgC
MKIIFDQGLENHHYIDQHTENFEAFKNSIAKISVEGMAERTGVELHLIEKAAKEIASFEKGCVICGDFFLRQPRAETNMQLLLNLSLLTGHLGQKSTGCFFSVGKNNLQGLCDMGVASDMLPGYKSLEDNSNLSELWQKEIPAEPGVKATELIEAIEKGNIKGLYLMGCDPIMSLYDSERTRKALEKLDFLLIQDLFSTESAQLAHAVLPSASFAEKEGSFTNGERRIQWIHKAIESYRNALPDWQIIQNLSDRLGYSMQYEDAWSIFQEIEKGVPQYKGASRYVKRMHGVQWPVLEGGDGTKFLKQENIHGTFFIIELEEEKPINDPAYPFILITGTSLYHCGTLSTYAEGPNAISSDDWIELNVNDGERLGIKEGEKVIIKSLQGEIKTKVTFKTEVTLHNSVPEGVVFAPDHFKNIMFNRLTRDSSVCQVAIEKER